MDPLEQDKIYLWLQSLQLPFHHDQVRKKDIFYYQLHMVFSDQQSSPGDSQLKIVKHTYWHPHM